MPDLITFGSHAATCSQLTCHHAHRVVAIGWGDLNPLKWLGKGAAAVATDAWKGAMTAVWSAGLWVLNLAFKIIDAFTTPDLSTGGPLATVLPYTFAVGAALALLMAFVQIGLAAFQRDGRSVARVLVGVAQFWGVWIGYITVAALLVSAAAGLTKGLLQGLLHVDAFAGFSNSGSWPRQVDDTVVVTVLGFCTIFLIFPAAIGYVLIMLVREAALMLLTATAPVSAAGLLSEGTRAWFWKTLRWFFASLMIAPLAALVLGIGVKITQGTVAGAGDKTAAAVGTAVVGCILILIGAICPLILFRLLAFVDPGTSSGAAMRQSFAANGGMAGLVGGKAAHAGGRDAAGSGAATKHDDQGRSQGESSADSVTQSRFASMAAGMSPIGTALQNGARVISGVAGKATAVGADVLGAAGVGHQAPYFGQGDLSSDPTGRGGTGSSPPGGTGTDSGPNGDTTAGDSTPMPPTPPTPPLPQPPTPTPPGGGGAGGLGGSPGGPGAAGGAGEAGAVGEVPIVPA
jgi:hypothetical protein